MEVKGVAAPKLHPLWEGGGSKEHLTPEKYQRASQILHLLPAFDSFSLVSQEAQSYEINFQTL